MIKCNASLSHSSQAKMSDDGTPRLATGWVLATLTPRNSDFNGITACTPSGELDIMAHVLYDVSHLTCLVYWFYFTGLVFVASSFAPT